MALPIAPEAIRKGRYDAVAGRIVWEDGTQEAIAFPESPTLRPTVTVVSTPTQQPNKPTKVRKPSEWRNRVTAATDTRRHEAVRLYCEERKTVTELAKLLHMNRAYASRVLKAAGVKIVCSGDPRGKRGAKAAQRCTISDRDLIDLVFREGSVTKAADTLDGVNMPWVWRRLRAMGLPKGRNGSKYVKVMRAFGLKPSWEEGGPVDGNP